LSERGKWRREHTRAKRDNQFAAIIHAIPLTICAHMLPSSMVFNNHDACMDNNAGVNTANSEEAAPLAYAKDHRPASF